MSERSLCYALSMALTEEDKQWITGMVKEELAAQIEGMETKLLTAFHGWASPLEARQRRHRDTIHDLEVDLDALSIRVKALEDKPNGKA